MKNHVSTFSPPGITDVENIRHEYQEFLQVSHNQDGSIANNAWNSLVLIYSTTDAKMEDPSSEIRK